MSLSDTKPSARKTIMMGTSCLIYGKVATMRWPIALFFAPWKDTEKHVLNDLAFKSKHLSPPGWQRVSVFSQALQEIMTILRAILKHCETQRQPLWHTQACHRHHDWEWCKASNWSNFWTTLGNGKWALSAMVNKYWHLVLLWTAIFFPYRCHS